MAYLFHTDAVAEILRRRPNPDFVEWLWTVPREDQFVSAVSVGELAAAAFQARDAGRHLANLRDRVLSSLTALPFDQGVAEVFGMVSTRREPSDAHLLTHADLQVAATALYHGLELVTRRTVPFRSVESLRVSRVLEAPPSLF